MLVGVCIFVILAASFGTTFQTGEVFVQPKKYEIEPGANVSFLCNSTEDISMYHWEIYGITIEPSWVKLQSNHSMKLDLNTAKIVEIHTHEADVLCVNAYRTSLGSSAIFFGYIPLAPEIECVMQNLDTMHCRWNYCDPRTEKHPERLHDTKYLVTYHTTHYSTAQNKHGNCTDKCLKNQGDHGNNSPTPRGDCDTAIFSPENANCFSSCSVVGDDSTRWEYWHEMEIRIDVSNRIGASSSKITFTPRMNIIFSPPMLKFVDVTSEDEEFGAAMKISAVFSPSVKNQQFFKYCGKFSVLEILYKEVAKDFDLQTLESYGEEEFWGDWENHVTDIAKTNVSFMKDAKKLEVQSHNEVTITKLPANSTFLVQANWKLQGTMCSGRWSANEFQKFSTGMLKPPGFYQTTLLYFSNSSPSSYFPFFNDDKLDLSSLMILWRHTQQTTFIHKCNAFEYQASSENDKCFAPYLLQKSSNFVPMKTNSTINGCRMKISAVNNNGTTSSPYFSADSDESNTACSQRILSVNLEEMQNKSLKFKVAWIWFSKNRSVECDVSSIQDNVTVTLFAWEEMCERCLQTAASEVTNTPFNVPVNTFYLNVVSAGINNSENHKIDFRNRILSGPLLNVSYPFRPHKAYRIAVSLSRFEEETVVQSPAALASGLYYHTIENPTGIPSRVACSDVGVSSMRIKWQDLPLHERNGPILGYKIFVTKTKECFSGDNGISCESPYDICDEDSVQNISIEFNKDRRDQLDGWNTENMLEKGDLSYFLEGLSPGTHHYVGIAAFNAAGTSECFRYATQATQAAADAQLAILVGIASGVTLIMALLALGWLCRRHPEICRRRSVPQPVVAISLGLDTDNELSSSDRGDDTYNWSSEYVDLFDEIKPLQGELEPIKNINNNFPDKFIFHRSDPSMIVDSNGLAPYSRISRPPESPCDHEIDSPSSDIPCCSSSTANESTPSTFGDSSEDGISSDEDNAIYTSPEIALILSSKSRCVQV